MRIWDWSKLNSLMRFLISKLSFYESYIINRVLSAESKIYTLVYSTVNYFIPN